MAYLSVADLKTYLDISSSDDDTLLGDLIDSAVQIIENETQTTFEAGSSTRYFTWGVDTGGHRDSWQDRRTLWFDTWLASAPTTVTNGDSTTIASSNYVLLDTNRPPYYGLKLKQDASVQWTYDDSPEDAISIVGNWGWSTTPPDDIVQVTRRLAAYLYRQKDAQIFDQTAFTELGRIQMKPRIPGDVRELLARYMWHTR